MLFCRVTICNDAIPSALLYHVTCASSLAPFCSPIYKRSTSKQPFGYVNVLQEEDVYPSIHQQNVLNQLRDWDLWGPLLICLSLAIILSAKAPVTQTSHVFTTVFIVMWVGATVVTINAQLLGASMSIFQSVCVRLEKETSHRPKIRRRSNLCGETILLLSGTHL